MVHINLCHTPAVRLRPALLPSVNTLKLRTVNSFNDTNIKVAASSTKCRFYFTLPLSPSSHRRPHACYRSAWLNVLLHFVLNLFTLCLRYLLLLLLCFAELLSATSSPSRSLQISLALLLLLL